MGAKAEEASLRKVMDSGPNKRQIVSGGVIVKSKAGSQNPSKSVTFGAASTLCVPEAGFGENNMVGHQTDTSRPLSSKDQSSRPSSSKSRVSDLEYEEELEERRRQRSAVLQSIGSNEKQRKVL